MSATEQAIGARHPSSDLLLRGVRRLASLANRAGEPEQVFRALAQELQTVLGAEEVHVHHIVGVPARRDLVVVYLNEDGRLSYHNAAGERPPAVSWVASTGRNFLAGGERELIAGLPGLSTGPAAARSALLSPLNVRGRTLAVVVLVARAPARFQERAVEQASALVEQAATVLALLYARAEAGTDAVTGCMNHRAMRRRLHEEVARAQRSSGRLSCLLIDLDDFKLVNDRHGHPVGDEVLRRVAETLMREFRSFDRVARYGGDEFVVILPEADRESAVHAAERALERLAEIAVARRAPAPAGAGLAPEPAGAGLGLPPGVAPAPLVAGVRASIGVAQWRASMSVDGLLEECDGALLQGKREGKRRVTAAR